MNRSVTRGNVLVLSHPVCHSYQYYVRFHSEGRIVYTIFGLLFWDIIFAPIPGSFETRYQTAPLDIAEDTFYTSRQEMIDNRLSEIKDGKAPEILQAIDKNYRKTRTWCVGVRWDLCETQDLLEILDVSSAFDLPYLLYLLFLFSDIIFLLHSA
jgi:fanconi-associated nuclease 1